MQILLIKRAGELSCLIFCKKYSDHQSPLPLLQLLNIAKRFLRFSFRYEV